MTYPPSVCQSDKHRSDEGDADDEDGIVASFEAEVRKCRIPCETSGPKGKREPVRPGERATDACGSDDTHSFGQGAFVTESRLRRLADAPEISQQNREKAKDEGDTDT